MMQRRIAMAMLVAASMVAAGCGDDCDPHGPDRCWHNTVQSCGSTYSDDTGQNSSIHWIQTDDCSASGAICFQPAGKSARCVLSTDPDPLCEGVNSYCIADDVVHCGEGYGLRRQTCGVSPEGYGPGYTHCLAAGPQDVVCVPPDALPNDACLPAGSQDALAPRDVCVAGGRATCLAGLAVEMIACRCYEDTQGLRCAGSIGDLCTSQCLTSLDCQLDSTGTSRCTTPCDPSDPSAAQYCRELYFLGGPQVSERPGTLTCRAGFCEWTN